MNKYLKFFHNLFNSCCNLFDNKPPVSYTVNHETSRLAQQLYYLTTDDNRGICDIALYVGSPDILEEKVSHIHDQTLKEEIAKYHDTRVVNIAGEIVESKTPELDGDIDLHLLKKKILAQSLPNGLCARPVVLGECPHANACLTCSDFCTTIEFLDQHKTQLEETKKIIKNAEKKGWQRQAEMNRRVKNNLEKIIKTLESGDKDIGRGLVVDEWTSEIGGGLNFKN